MKINRTEFLALLKALSPALVSGKNSIPELSHVWFSGTHASAFNDILGIKIEFPTEFIGGLLGDKLIGVLEHSTVDDIDIEVEGENALFEIGSASIVLACRPIEDWFWEPEVPEGTGDIITKEFIDSLPLLLMSVGSTTVLNPEQRGITIIQTDEAVDLYSTDAVSMGWIRLQTEDVSIYSGARVILPTDFCKQLKALENPVELRFDENAVYCLTDIVLGDKKVADKDNNPVRHPMLMFSKLVADDDPVPFADVVSQHVGDEYIAAEIPKQLKLRAERAMVLLDDQPIQLEIEDAVLRLFAQTPYGKIDDIIKLGNHPDIKVKVDMSLLHRVLDACDRITVMKNAIVLRGQKDFVHIISTK